MDKAIELGSCLYAVIGASFVAWGIWRAWVKPRADQGQPSVVDLAARRRPTGWSLSGELARLFLVPVDMSSTGARSGEYESVDAGVSQPISDASAPIAMPSSAVSGALTADEIQARAIATLLNAGLLTNRTKAIEQVFHCSVAAKSRPDTPYQKALTLVEQYQAPARTEYVGDMIERVKREVAAEH